MTNTRSASVSPLREAAVLAGGRSRRMGREKALVELAGRPLLERAILGLAASFERLLVSVRRGGPSPGVARVVERLRCEGLRVDFVEDRREGCPGPLGALEGVLGALEGPAVFVLPVDAPAVPGGLRDLLCRLALAPGRLGALPSWQGRLEPLHAAYRRDLLPRVTSLLERGELRARALAELPAIEILDLDRALGPGGPTELAGLEPREVFRNLNTPEDLRSLEEGE